MLSVWQLWDAAHWCNKVGKKPSSWPYGGHKPSSFHHLNMIAAAVPQFAAFYTVTSFTDGASELPSVPSICCALTPSAGWLSGVSTSTHADCSHCCQRDYAKFHSSRRRPLIGVISPCWDATALRIFANLNLKVPDQNIMFFCFTWMLLWFHPQFHCHVFP